MKARIVPRYRGLNQSLPRRLRWKRARIPTRKRIPRLHRPVNRALDRPSARVSLLHLAMTAAVTLIIWSLGAIFQTVYAARIYPHVTIDNVPVGGMTRGEALAALRDSESARVNQPIYVEADGHNWQVTPTQFGVHYDIAGAVDRALTLAHHGPLLVGGWDEAKTVFQGANVALTGAHDGSAVTRFVTEAAQAVHVSPRRADVGVRGDDVAIIRPPVPGHRLDIVAATSLLGTAINTHDATAVTLPLQPLESALGYDQANAALAQARRLLAAPVTFQWVAGSSTSWRLDRRGLLHLLTFTPTCAPGVCQFDLGINVRKLALAFDRGGVAASIDRAPAPASYELSPAANLMNASVNVVQDTPGVTINVYRAAQQVLQQADVPAGMRTIWLPTLKLYAPFNTQVAEALNFNQTVGATAWQFTGLDWTRLQNLQVAANVSNSTIVPAGKTFDLAAVAGPLTASHAYTTGDNVVNPSDITGVNGGVDQFASTVLGAAYDAGLPIVQRAHYPLLNALGPVGLDAAVSYGPHAPNLVFRNTTDHPVLIMTSENHDGNTAVYIFNSAGHAPGGRRGAYQSVVALPDVTLNPDGTVDTVIRRSVTIGGHVTPDRLSSHYTSIDP